MTEAQSVQLKGYLDSSEVLGIEYPAYAEMSDGTKVYNALKVTSRVREWVYVDYIGPEGQTKVESTTEVQVIKP